MNINIATPFHILQWYTYIVMIFIFQLVIIFPLSCIIFNDLYNRLISLDSIQTIPLNTLVTPQNYRFEQSFIRYDFSPLPQVLRSGIPQLIPLRSSVDYSLDMKIEFYCQHRFYSNMKYKSNMEIMDTVKIKIWINNDPKNQLLYQVKMPVICSNKDTSESTLSLSSTYKSFKGDQLLSNREITDRTKSLLSGTKRSFMDLYHDHWLNKFSIRDTIKIPTWAKSVHIQFDSISTFTVPKTDVLTDSIDNQMNVNIMKRLTFEPESSILQFRTIYEQGIRNFMLVHSWITYAIGVTIVHSILLIVFLLVGLYCFYKILTMRPSSKPVK
ncbi:seipin PWA37_002674 [Arxiozyma heterogenica]|uniref:Seipin n=1 Tax=Arxiozyma heterogenica TaxID=278026 RepID=A0AAN7WI20_9SACH|nr:hypothetical protein RI543_002121 [Kazachstania heterogenica]